MSMKKQWPQDVVWNADDHAINTLYKQLEKLNPFLLRKIMDKKLNKIFSINNNLG